MRAILLVVFCLLAGCKASPGDPARVNARAPESEASSPSGTRFPKGTELTANVSLSIGNRTLSIPGGGSIIRDLAIDTFGRVVVAGRHTNGTDDDVLVARFNPDGSLDTHFGVGGIILVSFGTGSEMAHSLALQPDGKIVIAGRSDPASSSYFDFAIVRLEEDGSLDLGFNGTGKLLASFGGSTDIGRAVKVQENGRIIAGGYSRTPHHTYPYRFASLRLLADGSFDSSYGEEGKIVTATVDTDNGATAMAIQSDGKIVLAGTAFIDNHNHLSVIRYRVDGSLDPEFGTAGILNQPLGDGDDNVNAVQIDTIGRIVIAGSLQKNGSYRQAFLHRLLPDGSADTSFANFGNFLLPGSEGETEFRALQIAEDNSIVSAGVSCAGACGSSTNRFLVSRIDESGASHSRFGQGGNEITSFLGNIDFADALYCTSLGTCIAGGRAKNASDVMELALHQFQVE